MKESDLRKWHRNLGIYLALFIIIQAGTGIILTLRDISVPHSHAHGENLSHNENRHAEDPVLHEHNTHETPHEAAESGERQKTFGQDAHIPKGHMNHEENTETTEPAWIQFLMALHHGGGSIGIIYHLLVGFGILTMAVLGVMIYFKIQAKTKTTKGENS